MKNPCKECLVYPACRERCDDLDKYNDKLMNAIKYSAISLVIVTFGLFTLVAILLRDNEVFSPEMTIIITVPITTALIFTGIYSFTDRYDISNRMLKKYPK